VCILFNINFSWTVKTCLIFDKNFVLNFAFQVIYKSLTFFNFWQDSLQYLKNMLHLYSTGTYFFYPIQYTLKEIIKSATSFILFDPNRKNSRKVTVRNHSGSVLIFWKPSEICYKKRYSKSKNTSHCRHSYQNWLRKWSEEVPSKKSKKGNNKIRRQSFCWCLEDLKLIL
jgi:hypothetical protein